MARKRSNGEALELVLRPDAPKKVRKARPDVARVVAVYNNEHLKRHGIRPLINGQSAGMLGLMITNWDEATVERLVRDFVWGNDPWAVKCGWTIDALYKIAPRMLTGADQMDERTASNVDAAMRSTQKKQ